MRKNSEDSSEEKYKVSKRGKKTSNAKKGRDRQVSSAEESDSASDNRYNRELSEQRRRDERISRLQKEKEFDQREERERRRRLEEEEDEYRLKRKLEENRKKETGQKSGLRPEMAASDLRGSVRGPYPSSQEQSVVLQPKRHLSEQEEVIVNKVLANIVNFMIED